MGLKLRKGMHIQILCWKNCVSQRGVWLRTVYNSVFSETPPSVSQPGVGLGAAQSHCLAFKYRIFFFLNTGFMQFLGDIR